MSEALPRRHLRSEPRSQLDDNLLYNDTRLGGEAASAMDRVVPRAREELLVGLVRVQVWVVRQQAAQEPDVCIGDGSVNCEAGVLAQLTAIELVAAREPNRADSAPKGGAEPGRLVDAHAEY